MCGVLALLFIAVPALEIYVLVAVGGHIGALPTLGIVLLTGLAGAALARHQGFAVLRRVQRSLAEGDRVGSSLAEAALVLVAAVLLVTPGFVTDLVGLSLLVPPIRAVAAARLVAWGASRVAASTIVVGPSPWGPPGRDEAGGDEAGDDDPPPPGVIDV